MLTNMPIYQPHNLQSDIMILGYSSCMEFGSGFSPWEVVNTHLLSTAQSHPFLALHHTWISWLHPIGPTESNIFDCCERELHSLRYWGLCCWACLLTVVVDEQRAIYSEHTAVMLKSHVEAVHCFKQTKAVILEWSGGPLHSSTRWRVGIAKDIPIASLDV